MQRRAPPCVWGNRFSHRGGCVRGRLEDGVERSEIGWCEMQQVDIQAGVVIYEDVTAIPPEYVRGLFYEGRLAGIRRFGRRHTRARSWARRGSRPRAPPDQRRTSAYLCGPVCPEHGTGAAVILPCANTGAMNRHLKEIVRCGSPGTRRCSSRRQYKL